MLVICAVVALEVALGELFSTAAWELIGWLPVLGVLAFVPVSTWYRSRSR